jgi:alcohol dehydrogenase
MLASHWQFFNPVRVVFGPGRLKDLPSLVRGRRALILASPGASKRGLSGKLLENIGASESCLSDQFVPKPSSETIELLCNRHAQPNGRFEVLVAAGGGSVLDIAKALSVRLAERPIPVIAIPTTAGSGSEVTPFVALWENGKKTSLDSGELFPEAALLDPELTLTLGWDQTLFSGLDALSQAFESVWNRRATPITFDLATRAIAGILPALKPLRADLKAVSLRSAMMESSLLSGLAISQTRTALAHSISYPLTARLGMPHGLACSFTLPAVLRFIEPADDGRLKELARRLAFPNVRALADAVADLLRDLEVGSKLSAFGAFGDFESHVSEMISPGRADNSLRAVDPDSVREILATTSGLFRGTG